jgi:hypothetical protein
MSLSAAALVVTFSALISPMALADQVDGTSYFEKATIDIPDLIPTNHAGTNSIKGSVMPNRDMSTKLTKDWTGTDTGSGAVGTKALGIYNTPTDNRGRKQALFCFLQKMNGVNGGSRHSSCAGVPWGGTTDWERAGSAVIVRQMIGNAWGVGSRTISGPEWTELYNRLVENDNLVMNRNWHNHNRNTAGVIVGGKYDAVKWQYFDNLGVDSWVFTANGSSVYALEIICANPLGTVTTLPPFTPVPADYALDPSVDSNGITSAEPGTDITIDGLVENVAANPSKETEWRLTQIVYGPGANPGTAGDDSTAQPCDFFSSTGRIPPPCTAVDSGTGRVFNANTIAVVRDNYVYTVPLNAEFGTRICFAVSVKPPTEIAADQDKWRHSDLLCIMVSKSPKMQVWGGDVRADGSISTSKRSYTGPNRTYGSWAEYGALSNGGNSGFATGAGLNTGNVSNSQSSWSALTFANTGSAGSCEFGCYSFLLNSSGMIDQFIVASPPANPGSADLNTWGSGTYSATDLTLAGTTIGTGKSIIILASGTVTIQGDIVYNDGPYNNIRDIPQVVIRAPRINIQNSARRVDAWLLAVTGTESGIINTCSDIPLGDALTSNTCNNPLVVNGPVVTDKLYLRRTAGSGSQPNERDAPAEIFNLRADAYLWGSSRGVGAEKARTVYTKELPPRF